MLISPKIVKPSKNRAFINWNNPISKSMVGCWLLNEGAGATSHNIATQMQAAGPTRMMRLISPAWTQGKFGSSLYFDRSGNHWTEALYNPQIDNLCFDDAGVNFMNCTILVWAKRGNIDGSGALLYKSDSDSGRGWFMDINSRSPGNWGFNVVGQTGDLERYANPLPDIGKWFQMVVTAKGRTSDATTVKIYLNGIEPSTYALSQSGTTNLSENSGGPGIPLWFGVSSTGSINFDGQIDHALIWRRVLSPTEILKLYKEPFCFLQRTRLQPAKAFLRRRRRILITF